MAERTSHASRQPNAALDGAVFSLRYQSESEHHESEKPLAATSVREAIRVARVEWNQLAGKAYIAMETGWAHPDGRGRASEYFHPVVYPHSPRLGYGMELQHLEGFEQPDPASYLERLKVYQENNPDARRHWGLLADYASLKGDDDSAEGKAFAQLWPAVRRITRLTEHYVAFVNNRMYFDNFIDESKLVERIAQEPTHQSAFIARIGEIKR